MAEKGRHNLPRLKPIGCRTLTSTAQYVEGTVTVVYCTWSWHFGSLGEIMVMKQKRFEHGCHKSLEVIGRLPGLRLITPR
jgi:hypothetical protein